MASWCNFSIAPLIAIILLKSNANQVWKHHSKPQGQVENAIRKHHCSSKPQGDSRVLQHKRHRQQRPHKATDQSTCQLGDGGVVCLIQTIEKVVFTQKYE